MMTVSDQTQYILRSGLIKLLEIKDADIRIMTLNQTRDAVDKGMHIRHSGWNALNSLMLRLGSKTLKGIISILQERARVFDRRHKFWE
jgi:hypothetical protein